MKKTSEIEKLESVLRSSQIVAGGFMGQDSRDVDEIIRQDSTAVERLGYSLKQVSERMLHLTEIAKSGLGIYVDVDEGLRGCVDEVKGRIVCPWPHPASFDKRLTTITDIDSGEEITWSDLNIHMISAHGFFEGHGSAMRIEPEKLINLIFRES